MTPSDPPPARSDEDPDPLTEPEQIPNDDDLGAADDPDPRGPSTAATADIEERQDTQRAAEREAGRPPKDAPAY